ncbi:hypothetical protein JAAARDRAFT_40846 [Jaapia argillacea MUCL 33604]|uniref:BTB domain-containing protein n=1 Tax=Jaapia argillacea MUCL 33604 TaxID=933084 RepID=A0A067PA30_9AGAM|nr:hypothetical protein JAAARDRAFT_40846 [Jaapia argillacea MUCL 33604]
MPGAESSPSSLKKMGVSASRTSSSQDRAHVSDVVSSPPSAASGSDQNRSLGGPRISPAGDIENANHSPQKAPAPKLRIPTAAHENPPASAEPPRHPSTSPTSGSAPHRAAPFPQLSPLATPLALPTEPPSQAGSSEQGWKLNRNPEADEDAFDAPSSSGNARSSSPELADIRDLLMSTQPPSSQSQFRTPYEGTSSSSRPRPKPRLLQSPSKKSVTSKGVKPKYESQSISIYQTVSPGKQSGRRPQSPISISDDSTSCDDLDSSQPSGSRTTANRVSPTLTARKRRRSSLAFDPKVPNSKRAKLAAGRSSLSPPRRRSSEFWYLDGSVIIQVENTLFRLHCAVLISESAYFAEIFEGKGKRKATEYHGETDDGEDGEGGADDGVGEAEGVEMLERCRVHKVLPKALRADDFEKLLIAMRDAITYIQSPPRCADVIAIFRAAVHLSFPKYRTFALTQINSIFVPEVTRASEIRPSDSTHIILLGREVLGSAVLTEDEEEKISICMKRAFYELVRVSGMGQSDLIDKSLSISPRATEKSSGKGKGKMRTSALVGPIDRVALSPADLLGLIEAREDLARFWVATTSRAPTMICPLQSSSVPSSSSVTASSSSPGPLHRCLSGNENQRDTHWSRMVHGTPIFSDHLYDPITGFQELIDAAKGTWTRETDRYCDACTLELVKRWNGEKKIVWDRFGLRLNLSA